MKKELLEINEMVKGDEIAEKIMSDLLDVYYKRERIGEFRKKLIHFSKPLIIIIAEALFMFGVTLLDLDAASEWLIDTDWSTVSADT